MEPSYRSTVFGPTCDGLDTILENTRLPKLKIGDYLAFENMGAYTISSGSSFNGFTTPKSTYIVSELCFEKAKDFFSTYFNNH